VRPFLRQLIRPRRVVELLLVIGILVAYLLVVTRGEIVTTLAGTNPSEAAHAAAAASNHPVTPSFGDPNP
jgi:hypothetical protein